MTGTAPPARPGPGRARRLGFPAEVDEVAARTVATGVAVVAWAAVALDLRWPVVVLAYGFAARVAAGPRYSPLALLATRVVAPRLGPGRLVPGPPKRFAQAIGLACSVLAGALFLAGLGGAGRVALAVLAAAATLEAAFGLCVGCQLFALGMKLGLVPQRVCERCVSPGPAGGPAR